MPLWNFANFIIQTIDRVIVPLVFAIAFIVFIWGVYTYFIAGAGDEEKRKEGKNFVLYALIGFFLMLSLWGIVNLLVGTFGFGSQARPGLPTFNGGSANGGGGSFGGGGCSSDNDCGIGGSCNNGTCSAAGGNGTCQTDAQCGAGASCVSGTCR